MIYIYKWVVKHRSFVLYGFSVIECIAAAVAVVSADLEREYFLAAGALIMLFNYFAVNLCYSRVVREILSQRRGGDHGYAIALSDEILASKQPPVLRAHFTINKSVFLRDMGQLNTALDLLMGLDPSGLPPLYRFLCYNNISDIYVSLKNVEKAEEYRGLAIETHESMPRGKAKDSYNRYLIISQAEILVLKGEYHAATEYLETIENREGDPGYHSIMAEALIGLGDKEAARHHYDKLIEMGFSDFFTQELSRKL